jgi:cytosine/adenosine deaminase-related metal-dependent hydrolase
VRIGLGTDTWPPDMIENMKLGVMLARIAERDASAVRATDLFDAATLGGAAALGRDDLGRLAPGAKADLVVIDLATPHLGPLIDPIQSLLLSCSGRDVRHVVIDGRVVMADGLIPGVDWDALAAQAQAQFDRLIALYPRRTFGHLPVATIFPPSYPQRGQSRL